MKFFFTVLSITGWLLFATAQQETARDVPRLLQQYASATTDTARIILLCRIAEAYRASKPDTSMTLAMDALSRSKAIKFKKGEIHSLIVQCVLYREKGDLPEALEQGLKALPIAEEEKLGYEQIYAAIRIANVYIAVRDYSKAISYLQKSEELLEKDYDEFQWAVIHYFYAVIYEQNNDLDAVEKKIKLLEERHGSEPTWIILLNRLRGHVAVKRKELPTAIKYYHESNAAANAEEGFREVSTTSNAMARVFRDLGERDSAIVYAKEALKYGEMLNYKNRILEASKLLATLYTDSDPAEAAKYYKMTLAANDSLYSVQKVLQLQSATMLEQERKAEQEAARIAYQNRIKQWTMLGGIAAVLIIALILYRNNRQKQKANQVLNKTLTDLRITQTQLIQSEKMASLGELTAGIAHEIQNPLNFVNNFSEVNGELIKELKIEAKKGNVEEVAAIANDIEFNSEKINHHGKRADSIVKGMLQHSRSGSGQKEPTDINALADEYLRLAYHGLRAKDNSFNATMKTDFDDRIDKVNIVPQDIGRVMLNLINNAFYAVAEKKAPPEGGIKNPQDIYEPTVTIKTLKNPPSVDRGASIEIRVADNGNGIPQKVLNKIFQPFFTTKPTGQGTGLGLSLAYDIITKGHGGVLKVETKEGEGSKFIIQLPDN